MWKRILFLTLGIAVGGGAGFLGSQYLCSSKSSKSGKSSYSSSNKSYSSNKAGSGNRARASKSKKSKSSYAAKKNKNIHNAKHKKSKKKKSQNHRADAQSNLSSTLASTEVSPVEQQASTPWISELSGESARLNMESVAKKESSCGNGACLADRDRAITLVGVVVETNDLAPRNAETLVDGDINMGDGQSRPALYVQ
jgi:hypothetical protein